MNKNIIIVNNDLIGFACGYVAWRSLHGSDADFYALDVNNFNILNLELNNNIDLFFLNFIYRKSIVYSVSIKVNSIKAIFNSAACALDVIEHVNNISIIRNHRSVIRDCWDFFVGDEDYPEILNLVDAHITDTQSKESIYFCAGMKRLDVKDNYEQWDKILSDKKAFDNVIKLGKAIIPE